MQVLGFLGSYLSFHRWEHHLPCHKEDRPLLGPLRRRSNSLAEGGLVLRLAAFLDPCPRTPELAWLNSFHASFHTGKDAISRQWDTRGSEGRGNRR